MLKYSYYSILSYKKITFNINQIANLGHHLHTHHLDIHVFVPSHLENRSINQSSCMSPPALEQMAQMSSKAYTRHTRESFANLCQIKLRFWKPQPTAECLSRFMPQHQCHYLFCWHQQLITICLSGNYGKWLLYYLIMYHWSWHTYSSPHCY